MTSIDNMYQENLEENSPALDAPMTTQRRYKKKKKERLIAATGNNTET